MMMTRALISAMLLALVGVPPLAAQTPATIMVPSEVPPPTYTGADYVDRRGCVFTRAVIDGAVSWVPRVTAQRQQVCGRSPTLAPVQSAGASAPARATRRQEVDEIASHTRIVARHVYDGRRNTVVTSVPRGYRPVWKDGRLNPRRSEMTLAPSVIRTQARPPRGFTVAWEDDRLNTHRGRQTAAGISQMDRIWTRTIPRTLRAIPTDVPVVGIEKLRQRRNAPFWEPGLPDQPQVGTGSVTRVSSRSSPAPIWSEPHR